MRRLAILLLLSVSIGAGAQGFVIHGFGDPRAATPVPNCAQSRFYVDDSTQKMYQATKGSPCAWIDPDNPVLTSIVASTNATINVQAPPYNLACNGTTDDTVAFGLAVAAADQTGALLIFPANATCSLQFLALSTISLSGTVRWQGSNTTIAISPALSPAAPLSQAFGGSGINALDIGGFTFQGNANSVAAFNIAGGTNQNLKFHDNVFTGFQGCPASGQSQQLNAGIILDGAIHAKIEDNRFLNGGCSSYWNTSGPTGAAVYNYTNPAYDWLISGNTVDNTYGEMGLLLFNLFESTIHDNDIRDVVLGGGSETTASGYGVAIYGTQICGTATLASPSGLSRTSNVVTFAFSGTCSPALVAGDHIKLTGSTSVGGTGFDGLYTLTAGGTTSAVGTLDVGTPLANDTGGGGVPQYAPQLNTIHNNRIKNVAGIGIYCQGCTESSVNNNVLFKVCQSMSDTSLPCGFVALNGDHRVSVDGNAAVRSGKDGIVSASDGTGNTLYGNSVGGVTNNGLRLRGTDTKEAWFGNSVNGATTGQLFDGGAQKNASLGNTFVGISADHITLQNSLSAFNLVALNILDGGAIFTTTGIFNSGGGENVFALNLAASFRGPVFDIRAVNDLAALNYVYGGTGNGFSTSSASYGLFTKNYLNSQATGFNDGSAGQSNVISDNYIASATTPLSGINGLAIGNQLKGGASGVFQLGSCTLVAGTCTISTAEVQSTDNGKIWCTRGSTGANPGFPFASSITAGTSFVVTSTNSSDTGNVSCEIRH